MSTWVCHPPRRSEALWRGPPQRKRGGDPARGAAPWLDRVGLFGKWSWEQEESRARQGDSCVGDLGPGRCLVLPGSKQAAVAGVRRVRGKVFREVGMGEKRAQ